MDDRLHIQDLPLAGLKQIIRRAISDQRGSFQRLYCQQILEQHSILEPIAQINLTHTRKKGSIRGMHYQNPPYGETKVVSCLRGKVLDVAIDLRQGSPTFLKWHAEILSPDLNNSLLIPKGFAHGFQTLTEDCELLYFHTAAYHPQAEAGLSPFDPRLNLDWPLSVTELSDRDRNHPLLTDNFQGVSYEV
ncbi:MAG TPA: dTDP-4-dehydrorhamnose 3,5-epimerase family protein [Gammaproteobacteria bacterium]|nr:dTDP-4-dehydrorhamnose 3,5-epimerase family protein [Gammaproteobacteria bacterium]